MTCLFFGSAVLVTLLWNHCEIQMTNIPQTAPVWRSLLQSHKILNELCFFPRNRKKGNNWDYTSGSANRNHGVSVKVSKHVFAWPQRWLSLWRGIEACFVIWPHCFLCNHYWKALCISSLLQILPRVCRKTLQISSNTTTLKHNHTADTGLACLCLLVFLFTL